jgi:integrase
MAVRPRGSGFQVDFSYKGERVRKDGFTSALEAEQWERGERTRLERGEALGVPVSAALSRCDTMRQLYDATYERFWRGSKAESSSSATALAVVKLLGETRHPATVNAVAIDGMVSELKRQGNSGGTINRKLAALSKMMHFAKDRDWIPSLPKIERQKESEHRVRWLTAEEEVAVLTWLTNTSRPAMKDLVVLLVDTGLRLSEALGLAWSDVEDDWIRVWSSKNGKPRSVPKTPRVRDLFQRRKTEAPADFTSVFWNLDFWSAEYQWKAVREALGKADDEQFVMHMLRHTFCSRLAQRGVQIQTIQQLAGHKSIQMTMRYAHLCPANLQKAMEVLE